MTNILIVSKDQLLTEKWASLLSHKYAVHSQSSLIDIATNSANQSLLIVDAEVLDCSGVSCKQLSESAAKVLIIGNNWSEKNQIEALLSGASGYCAKSIQPSLLFKAAESVLRGDIWIQRHLIPRVIRILVKSAQLADNQSNIPANSQLDSLSLRELDVAKMIRAGESNRSIAAILNISERTVKAHLTSIFKKLNVPDRLHLAIYLKEHGY